MKTVVICAKNDREFAADVLRLLKSLDMNGQAYSVSEGWRGEDRRLDEILTSASHTIVVYTVRSCRSSWLPFLAGLSLGSDQPLMLYRPLREPEVESFLSPFFLFQTMDSLSAFLETEKREWSAVAARRDARRELLELGVSFRGETFAESVREGNMRAVELFLRAGMPADTRDKKGVPILCLAAREGHRGVVDYLIANRADVDLQSEDRGNSAIMDAAAGGRDSIVADLLKAGASLDLQSKDGQTALILAVGKNNAVIASLLLDAGANPDLSDKLGFSARKYAKLFHNQQMTDLFDRIPSDVAQSSAIV